LTDGRLHPGALVLADNVLWSGRVSGARPVDDDDRNTAALRAFSERVLADERFTSTIVPVGDGLLVATWRG
jgi:predicted O-methyltransferase YrrM